MDHQVLDHHVSPMAPCGQRNCYKLQVWPDQFRRSVGRIYLEDQYNIFRGKETLPMSRLASMAKK